MGNIYFHQELNMLEIWRMECKRYSYNWMYVYNKIGFMVKAHCTLQMEASLKQNGVMEKQLDLVLGYNSFFDFLWFQNFDFSGYVYF